MDFDVQRYMLILRRWSGFLVATVGGAALVSWLLAAQGRVGDSYSVEPWLVVAIVTLGILIWGLIGIFGIEFLIDDIRTVGDVIRNTPAPVLAEIEAGPNGESATPFAAFDGDRTEAAGAFFAAESSLLSLDGQERGRVVLVCSPQSTPFAASLCSAAGANLAAAAALAGRSTLLIDADRFDGGLSESLDLGGYEGFADALADPASEFTFHVVPSVPNLHMLPAGRTPISGNTQLTRAHLRQLVERPGARVSLVVIAGPPVDRESHGLGPSLAAAADDVVLIAVAGETKRRAMRRTVHTLEAIGANLAGVVFVRDTDPAFMGALRSLATGALARTGSASPGPSGGGQSPESRVLSQGEATLDPGPGTQDSAAAAPGGWDRLSGAGARLAAIIVTSARRPSLPKRSGPAQRKAVAAPGSIRVRTQLAVAQIVRAAARRPAAPLREQAAGQVAPGPAVTPAGRVREPRQTAVLGRTAVLGEMNGRRPDGAGGDIVPEWLDAAEKEHRRGNLTEARRLVQRVLDREPHNEEAWQMRLLLSKPALTPQPIEQSARQPTQPQRQQRVMPLRVPVPRRMPGAMWIALPLLALAGLGVASAGGYLSWPWLPGLLNGQETTRAPLLAATPAVPAAPPASASSPEVFFPETGYTVSEPFLGYWNVHSGLRLFGYPISPRMTAQSKDGESLEVQYFERARFELHPGTDGGPPLVLLGTLGLEAPIRGTEARPLPEGLQGEEGLQGDEIGFQVGQGQISVPRKFAAFWHNNGGLPIFGNPITPVLNDTTGGGQLAVQYFERARFEYHPEHAGTDSEIQLARLGVMVYKK